MRIPILFQDPDLVVVDKPAGIPTHQPPDPGDPYPGDAARFVQAQTGLPYLGMHQRLDADTSGVLLFAARREANPALAAAFEGLLCMQSLSGAVTRRAARGPRRRSMPPSSVSTASVIVPPLTAIPAGWPRGRDIGRRITGRVSGGGVGVRHQCIAPAPLTASSNSSPKPAGRTRFASIWRTSAARWWSIPSTARPTDLRPRCICTRISSRRRTRRRASRITFTAGGNIAAEYAEHAEVIISSAPLAMTLTDRSTCGTRMPRLVQDVILSGLTTQSQAGRNPSEGSRPDWRDPSLALSRDGNWVVHPLRVTASTLLSMKVPHIRDALAAPDALRALLRLAVARRAPWRLIRKRTSTG